ncbi:MAG: (Fe-S)-binding protein [Flavobacteriales bacterium]|nr:(Fe-S)-binding protein [Flavobacteriales bacterium]
MIAQILFVLLLGVASYMAWKRFSFVRRNIFLGRNMTIEGDSSERWNTMFRVALGQGKMFTRPLAAVMHLFIYVGFIIINIELLEIVVDGIFGTHRILSFMGGFYNFLIGSFEWLAVLVLVSCVAFLLRRNVLKLKRLNMRELTKWPRTDANLILITEILLMTAFLKMNAADYILQSRGAEHYGVAGAFPVSSHLAPIMEGLSDHTLIFVERFCWWFHIIGILGFLVYVTYSKHLHIILAFPNTYYSKLKPAGEINNLQSVTNEVKLMLDPSAAVPPSDGTPQRFGAKDVMDLSWVQLMNAYSCTECGRCTSECPANQTGKLLSPRKIMMDTRDRLEEVGNKMDANGGKWEDDGRSLLRDYITEEELWACTTCNACTNACPVNINPMEIIVDLRRYLIMEESKSPESITVMFNNIENNGAPWAMSAMDRDQWRNS